MEEERVQAGNSSLYVRTLDIRWSEGVNLSRDAEPSTSGVTIVDPNSQYICED